MPAPISTRSGNADPAPSRLAAHRMRMRSSGLRVVQLWVPDTAQPDFAAQCQRQSSLAAQADRADDNQRWLDAAFDELAGSL